MIIKAGTIGTWNAVMLKNYSAKLGAKVIVTEDCDTSSRLDSSSLVQVKWIDELANGECGRQNDGGYFHEDFIWEEAPVYDVNKTVEVAVATSQLGDYIIIGQLLQVLPLFDDNYSNSFTRAYLQDASYCKYGWSVSESNEAIDLCVEKGLFKLI
jgi:hypothetical protein